MKKCDDMHVQNLKKLGQIVAVHFNFQDWDIGA